MSDEHTGEEIDKQVLYRLLAKRFPGGGMFRRFLLWLVLDSKVRLGPLAPWVFGLALGRWPHRVKK